MEEKEPPPPPLSTGRMHTLDSLDIRIVRALMGSDAASPQDLMFRVPIHAIAKSLRVDENTVRSRIDRWRKTGYLRGWRVAMNPTLFGLEMFQTWLDVHPDSRKADIVRRIAALGMVGGTKDYFGDSIWVSLYCRNETTFASALRQISRICNSERTIWVKSFFPKCELFISETDRNIIGLLQRDPWKSFVSVAKELGLSTRTVRRRISRMTEAEAMFIVADINLKAVRGAHFADLLVLYQDGKMGRKVRKGLAEKLEKLTIFADPGPRYDLFALQLDNISNVREILHLVKSESGVADARLDLLEDVVLLRDASQAKLGMEQQGEQEVTLQKNKHE